jgi:hypothetical protein
VPPRAFFTPQHALSPVWAPSGSGSRAPPADASAQRYAEEAHPIFREIYKAFPDPERVWAAYTDLMQRPLDGSSVEESTASAEARMRLLPLHLSLVLRAITPNVHSRRVVARRDKRRRRDEVSAEKYADAMSNADELRAAGESSESGAAGRSSYPQPVPSAPPLVAFRPGGQLTTTQRSSSILVDDTIHQYLTRATTLFEHMRRLSAELTTPLASTSSALPDIEAHPDMADYNHVLDVIAPSGNMMALTRLWREIQEQSTAEEQKRYQPRRSLLGWLFPDAGPTPAPPLLEPNRRTYQAMMLGLSRHLANSLVRSHAAALRAGTRSERKKLGKAERRAARIQAREEWLQSKIKGPPQVRARTAADIDARRAVELLDDMAKRGVTPDVVTLDLAARMLRLAGHMPALKALLRVSYGVDLDALDAQPERPAESKLTVHTLNTILMALGEHESVPKMIAAYETITRPLPRGEQLAEAAEEAPQGSLFAMNWRDLRPRDEAASETQASQADDDDAPLPYSHPDAITPNLTTYKTLIKHACTAPNASQVATPALGDWGRKMEDLARQEGQYLCVAQYVLVEAVESYEDEVRRMAVQLGVGDVELGEEAAHAARLAEVEQTREAKAARRAQAAAAAEAQAAQDALDSPDALQAETAETAPSGEASSQLETEPSSLHDASQAPLAPFDEAPQAEPSPSDETPTSASSETVAESWLDEDAAGEASAPVALPYFDAPHHAPSPELFESLASLTGRAEQQRARWWVVRLQKRALLALYAEHAVVQRALQRWDERRFRDAERTRVTQLNKALSKALKHVERRIDELHRDVDERTAHAEQARFVRNQQRKRRTQRAQELKREEQRAAALLAAEAAEKKRLRELAREASPLPPQPEAEAAPVALAQ